MPWAAPGGVAETVSAQLSVWQMWAGGQRPRDWLVTGCGPITAESREGAHRLHVTRLSCMPAGRHVIHSCIRQPALGGVSCTLAVTDLTWKICTWHLHRPATVCTWHQPGWSRNMLGAMPTGPSGFADLTCDSPSWLNPAHGQCLCACTLFDSPRPAVYSASGGPRWDSRAGQEPGSPSVEVRGSEAGALSFCPRDLGLWRGTGPGLLCPGNP